MGGGSQSNSGGGFFSYPRPGGEGVFGPVDEPRSMCSAPTLVLTTAAIGAAGYFGYNHMQKEKKKKEIESSAGGKPWYLRPVTLVTTGLLAVTGAATRWWYRPIHEYLMECPTLVKWLCLKSWLPEPKAK